MIVKEINKENDWNSPYWTKDMKDKMEKGDSNQQIGMNLILENETMKVWGIDLPPHQSLPFHKHSTPYFYVSKSNGKSRSYFSNGKIIETEYKMDDIRYFNDLSEDNYFIHNLENIGDTTLLFATVEFKKP